MEKKINNSISSISCLHTITANFLLDELAKEGLSNIASSHGNILFQLSKVEKLSMQELAKKINRDKSTATVLVRKLIKEKLIAEEINENDKRNKNIYLTEKGKKYNSITAKISTCLLDTFYKGFSDKEKEEFVSYLNRIIDNFN